MEEKIKQLIEIVKELGWEFAIPSGGGSEDDGNIHGMIIGEDSYVNYILKHYNYGKFNETSLHQW